MNSTKEIFCHQGAHCSEQMVQVDKQVALRLISYTPALSVGNNPIIFVGGLSTIIESFGDIILELTKDFPIHYVETRDRPSSQIEGEVSFDVETSGHDIVSVIQALGLKDKEYILLSYSLGGAIVSDAYRFLKSKPRKMIYFEPSPVFHYPKWSLKLIKLTFGVNLSKLRPIAKWYMRNFIIDKKADAEMVRISSNALDSAEPYKLKSTVLAIADYAVWDRLADIDCPALIIAASKDKMHVKDEIEKMCNLIRDCTYIDLETNKRSHSIEAGYVIRNFIKG